MVERPGRSEAWFLTEPAKNTVTDINPEFREQLELAEGMSSGLVRLYSTRAETGILFGAERRHNRVGNIDNTFVTDSKGLRWEDLDVKSPGLIEIGPGPDGADLHVFPWQRFQETLVSEAKIWGGNDLESARHAFKYQRILEDLGVRTYKSLFVTQLDEWFYKGEKVPVSAIPVVSKFAPVMDDNDALPEGYVLGVEVRACRTKTRMQAITECRMTKGGDTQKIRREIDRARALVCEERGLHELPVEDYLDWFVESHGRNLGILHGAGLVHRFMHPGNVTLDCRILDLDSVETFAEAHAALNERALEDGTSVTEENAREHYVIADTRTENLALFVRHVCAAYDIPMRGEVTARFLNAYRKAQQTLPPERHTSDAAAQARR